MEYGPAKAGMPVMAAVGLVSFVVGVGLTFGGPGLLAFGALLVVLYVAFGY
jgi:hypothetical protein